MTYLSYQNNICNLGNFQTRYPMKSAGQLLFLFAPFDPKTDKWTLDGLDQKSKNQRVLGIDYSLKFKVITQQSLLD